MRTAFEPGLLGRSVLQIGMDTPQVTTHLLAESIDRLHEPGVDAVLGPATDGGWWALGLRVPADAKVLRDVPMSRSDTGKRTREALLAVGLDVRPLPELSDVDTMADVARVARPGLLGHRGDAVGGWWAGKGPCWLELATGERIVLPIDRWRSEPEDGDELLLRQCTGPTLDVGCGPGRLTVALVRRGVVALGVDISPVAVRLTVERGAPALRRDVFGRLPAEGRWRHALLADGNIGIGGDPVRLLRRLSELLCRTGTALVEVEPPGAGLRLDRVRFAGGEDWLTWAWLGADAIERIAREAGLVTRWVREHGQRWFAELARP